MKLDSKSVWNDQGLLAKAKNVFSQNGEDGVIEEVFSIVGTSNQLCCEFGAWDGVHLSNTRHLLLNGWRGVLIESDAARFARLQNTYRDSPSVICVNRTVNDAEDHLEAILEAVGFRDELDFLSIDIDGEDYYVFKHMRLRPRLVSVEVNAGHDADGDGLIPRMIAAHNVGQPLQAFIEVASGLGYRLICYTGNAFFLRDDLGHRSQLPGLSARTAYEQFLSHLDRPSKRWLYMVNKGWVNPWHTYRNPYVTCARLGMSPIEVLRTHLIDHPSEAAKHKVRELVSKVVLACTPAVFPHLKQPNNDSS